jgi:hypothetical protein
MSGHARKTSKRGKTMSSEELAQRLLAMKRWQKKSSRKSGKGKSVSKAAAVKSTEYSNASRVKSNTMNADDLTRFEEIGSLIDDIVGYGNEGEGAANVGLSLPFWNIKPLMKPGDYNNDVVKKIKGALGERSLSVFKKYGDSEIDEVVGYIKVFLTRLNGRHDNDVEILKKIRENIDYLLYKTMPKFIRPLSSEEAGAGSKGGYRKRRSKKVKRSRRRLTQRR